jgi:hypothetical protein
MEKRIVGSAIVACWLLIGSPAPAQTRVKQVTNTYTAKFVCGVQYGGLLSTGGAELAGRYLTEISISNNTGVPITFRKKVSRLAGGQSPTDPQATAMEMLNPGQAMAVTCLDIYQHLHGRTYSADSEQGLVVIEVYYVPAIEPAPPPDPLDVAGTYTYRGDSQENRDPTRVGNSGVSISIVVYSAKGNAHILH